MRDDDLDRILAAEEKILPSSGFTASFMEALQRETSAPPPIPFPWRRAAPGIGVAALSLLLLLAVLFAAGTKEPSSPLPVQTAWLASFLDVASRVGLHWMFVGLLLTLASLKLSMRIASRRT
jgi:hypothetical protein